MKTHVNVSLQVENICVSNNIVILIFMECLVEMFKNNKGTTIFLTIMLRWDNITVMYIQFDYLYFKNVCYL